MKHLFRIYLVLFILFSDFKMFAQPGDENPDGDLDGGDEPATPISGRLMILLVMGLLFAFYKFKTYQKATTQE